VLYVALAMLCIRAGKSAYVQLNSIGWCAGRSCFDGLPMVAYQAPLPEIT